MNWTRLFKNVEFLLYILELHLDAHIIHNSELSEHVSAHDAHNPEHFEYYDSWCSCSRVLWARLSISAHVSRPFEHFQSSEYLLVAYFLIWIVTTRQQFIRNKAWQDLNILIINAKKCQKRIKRSIKFMKQRWSDETMNQLMLEIKDHYIANEIVKLIKKYSINLKKIIKRLQLTVFKCKKKMNRNIWATAVYILNDFKRAHSKTYSDLSASTRENFRAADLMIRNMKLIEDF